MRAGNPARGSDSANYSRFIPLDWSDRRSQDAPRMS